MIFLQNQAAEKENTEEKFAKFKKIANFSGEPFENSLNNKKEVNYSKFSEE